MPLQKAVDFEDWGHDRSETAPRCCTDEAGCVVCNALNSRDLETDNTYYNQELIFVVWFLDWSCQQQWWQCNETHWRWREWLAQFSASWSAVLGPPNMWQCSWGLWSPECRPGVRSTFD
jgi:hypothetical protein